ncbi:MAG TPA: hypothetical protein VMS60_06695 [Solirubrobacterales bacterium]|nr:hypothetical protein [Solirubrobacterales bacterium]
MALLAALTTSVVVITGAQADESNLPHFTAFNKATAKHENAVLKGTIEEGPHELRTLTKTFCHHVEYEATLTGGLGESLTATPKFFGHKGLTTAPECESEGATETWTTDIEMNGCDFKYPITTEISGTTYTSRPDILCPPGKQIDIKITKPGNATCTVQIPEQKNIGHSFIYNKVTGDGREDITIENAWQGFSYSTSPAVNCGVPDKTWTNGEYKGKVTLTAQNEEAKPEPMNITIQKVVTP